MGLICFPFSIYFNLKSYIVDLNVMDSKKKN